MAGISNAYAHIAALLVTAETNKQVESQFSCTSLPFHGCHLHFKKIPYAEISQIDFTLNEDCLGIYHHHLGRVVKNAYKIEKYMLFPRKPRMTKENSLLLCPIQKDHL